MSLWLDVRYTLRLLKRSWGFSLLSMAVVALGIGLSVYLLTFVNTIFYKAPPFPDSDRLVNISRSDDGVTMTGGSFSPFVFQYLQQRAERFEVLGAYAGITANIVSAQATPFYDFLM